MNLPQIVSGDQWLAARKELLAREKELTRMRDALNADRRRLPMVRIDKDYVFEGPQGQVGLPDLLPAPASSSSSMSCSTRAGTRPARAARPA